MYRYFSALKSKGLSDESIQPRATYNNSLAPSSNYIGVKIRVKFDCHCLKQNKVPFTHKKVLNIYIVYEINLLPFKRSVDFTLGNSLFGVLKLTENADLGKYKYYGYGIGFNAREKYQIVADLVKT